MFGVLGGALIGFGFAAHALAAAEPGKGEQVFKLHEVPVFGRGNHQFLRGQMAVCQEAPFSEVTAYPKLTSKRPLYGSIAFAEPEPKASARTQYYFVLDFSNQPEVLFASPAKDLRVKPGDTLEVKAVLVDPKLNGNQETLTVEVHYDTLELYGKLSASRAVTVVR